MRKVISPLLDNKIGFLEASDKLLIRYMSWHNKISPRAAILIFTGRTEFIEKYYETICDLLDFGYDVIAFDWRGQGLSGRMLPRLPMRGHVVSYDQYLSDVGLLLERIVAPWVRAPLAILAHSMGGHIALRFLHDHPGVAACAVLSAPMVEINPGMPSSIAGLIARTMTRLGCASAYAPRQRDYNPTDQNFEGNLLTSDPTRFRAIHEFIAATPDLALGGVTYGWVAATFRSSAVLLAPGYAEAITTPVLVCQAGRDAIVRNPTQDALVARMPRAELRRFPGAQHELLMERDAIRTAFLNAFEQFVQTHLSSRSERE